MDLEVELDKFLKIKTNGRDDSNSNFTNYPYEATPYSVLQVLANSGYISKRDKIIDFGCGKGRVDFYLSHFAKAKMIGVEYDLRLYESANKNLESILYKDRISFVYKNAKEFEIPSDTTGAYFFNPFSVEVLKDVVNNIKESLKAYPREFKFYFYYPSNEYMNLLLEYEDILYIESLDCKDLFEGNNPREQIAVFKFR